MKKRITRLLAIACILSLLVGSFAYFTDRVHVSTQATVGNIDLIFTDLSLASESYAVQDDVGTHSDTPPQARDKVWDNNSLLVDDGVLNPGDVIDMDFKLTNLATKSIDVKAQFVLLSKVEIDANQLAISVDGEILTPSTSHEEAGEYFYLYELDQIVLSGDREPDGMDGSVGKTYEVALVFDRLAKNEFMKNNVELYLDVYAKQHRNTTDADWALIDSYETVYVSPN